MFEVKEKRLVAQPAVVIRAKARADQLGPVMGELLPAVWAFLQERAVEPAGPPFSRYLDMEGDEWEFECGIAVSVPVAGEGRIEASELPAGDAASTMHVGPYETLGETWAALRGWLAECGKRQGSAPWELYWTDPGEVANPAEWRTELVAPLES